MIPAITIVDPTSYEVLDAALKQLDDFDWAIFTSANAVEAFKQRLGPRQPPSSLRIAAIGPSTARAVEAAGFSTNLIPPQAVAESLAEALLPFTRHPDRRPARHLLVRAEEGREHLAGVLRAAGAQVTVAPAYRTVIPGDSIELLRDLLLEQGNGLAAITFTSSSTVRNLLALCEAAGVSLPPEALRISIGPITSATMRETGLPPHAEAPQATVAALAETVVGCLQNRQGSD